MGEQLTLLRQDAASIGAGAGAAGEGRHSLALPLGLDSEPLVQGQGDDGRPEAQRLDPSRALVLADFAPPHVNPLDTALRWAYRLGVPGSVLTSPLRKPANPRLLATVASPLEGERATGVALRAGHFLVHGVKAPIGQVDFKNPVELAKTQQQAVGQRQRPARERCTGTARRISRSMP